MHESGWQLDPDTRAACHRPCRTKKSHDPYKLLKGGLYRGLYGLYRGFIGIMEKKMETTILNSHHDDCLGTMPLQAETFAD